MPHRFPLDAGLLAISCALACVTAAEDVTIEHDGLSCVVAEKFVRLEANFKPASVGRARAYFRAADTPSWYYVEMRPEASAFYGTLPKPQKTIKRIDYYIEAVATGFQEARTNEFDPEVVPDGGACSRKGAIAILGEGARIVVKGPAGAPAVPPGFLAAGMVSEAGSSGSSAAAHGSGKTIALVAGGAAVVGGVALAAGGGGDSGSGSTPSSSSSSSSAPTNAPPNLTATWVGAGADGFVTSRTALGSTCQSAANVTMPLTQSGGTVSGSCTAVTRSALPAGCDTVGGADTGNVTGTINGSNVALIWQFRDKTWRLVGTVSGNRMSGTLTGTSGDRIDGWTGTWAVSH
jgi:hypothetical protein